MYELFTGAVTLSKSKIILYQYPRGTVELDFAEVIKLQSGNKNNLFMLAKNQAACINMYPLIAKKFNLEHLYIETWWRGSGGKMRSRCGGNIKVMNINKIKFESLPEFKYTKDHSKWAIGYSEYHLMET